MAEVKVFYGNNVEVSENGKVVYSTDKPCVIESLEWGTNHDTTVGPRLWDYNAESKSGFRNYFVTVSRYGGLSTIRPGIIGSNGHGLFQVRAYDDKNHNYAFSLKRPIEMPAGAHLVFEGYNAYTGGDAVGYHLVVREL